MQATVTTFDGDTGEGTVVADDGRILTFDAAAFAAGGLRRLSRGQRVRVTQNPSGAVAVVTIYTLRDPSDSDDGAEGVGPSPSR